jgi:hypothetical protein
MKNQIDQITVRTHHETGANIILITRLASMAMERISKKFCLEIFADDFDELRWDRRADHDLVIGG